MAITFYYKVWVFFFLDNFLLWIFHLWPLSQNWCFRKKDFHPNFCAASKWASLVCRIFYQGLGQKTCNDETYWRDENKFMKKRFWLLCEADFGDFGSRLKLRKPKDFCFLKLCHVIIDIGIFTLQSIVKTTWLYCELFTTSIIFVLDDLSTIWLCEWISFKKPFEMWICNCCPLEPKWGIVNIDKILAFNDKMLRAPF